MNPGFPIPMVIDRDKVARSRLSEERGQSRAGDLLTDAQDSLPLACNFHTPFLIFLFTTVEKLWDPMTLERPVLIPDFLIPLLGRADKNAVSLNRILKFIGKR